MRNQIGKTNWVTQRRIKSEEKKKLNTKALPEVSKPTKYPVILCHGLGGDKPLLTYFKNVPEDLQGLNCNILVPKVTRYGSVYRRGEELNAQIRGFVSRVGCPKVNIIAHSMGGLDARYFITHLEGHQVTASLITLSTPHKGSAYADQVLRATTAVGLERVFAAAVLPFIMEGHRHVTRHFLQVQIK
jgi:triacylglycerol esterase/lipase EstA (alpha/beta hydrolase family)